MADFRFPRDGYHTTVIGTTGSGKSTLAAHLLSRSPFHLRPYFIVDYKRETIFQQCKRIIELDVRETLPREPGVYIVRPIPSQIEEVEAWFERLWHHENSGLYIDEGYLTPDKAWLRNILCTGRSLGITVIASTQRPVDVPRFFFTEATYFSVFHLNDKKDKQRVNEYTVEGMVDKPLAPFHSYWYDRSQHRADDPNPFAVLSPVPNAEMIIELIDSRLKPRHQVI